MGSGNVLGGEGEGGREVPAENSHVPLKAPHWTRVLRVPLRPGQEGKKNNNTPVLRQETRPGGAGSVGFPP